MKQETLNIISAVATISISVLGMLVAFYIFYRTFSERIKIKSLEVAVEELQNKVEKIYLNSKEVELVLSDLYARIDNSILLTVLSEKHPEKFDKQLKKLREHKVFCNRHFLELSLLSRDRRKRTAALQEITFGIGDWASLDVLVKYRNYFDGAEREEFKKFEGILRERLRKITPISSKGWSGI